MNNKNIKISKIIIPNKKINYFVFTILIFGLISGSIFLLNLNEFDKNNIILQIQNFILNINKNNIDIGHAFKNSIIINYIFVFLIWGFGLSIVGVIFNVFLTYIKGFIIGFTVAAIILCYRLRGLLLAFIYVFFGQVLNAVVVCILCIYSIMLSKNMLSIIFNKKIRKRNFIIKKYFIILLFSIIITFIASLLEVYIFPNIIKVLISIYFNK